MLGIGKLPASPPRSYGEQGRQVGPYERIYGAYLNAVYGAFDLDIDYAVLVKMYGNEVGKADNKYSPAERTGCKTNWGSRTPEEKHVSTSYVERRNLTMRTHMRRFTRLTNVFSKKIENHCHAIALHFVYYNFVKQHKTLGVTPQWLPD